MYKRKPDHGYYGNRQYTKIEVDESKYRMYRTITKDNMFKIIDDVKNEPTLEEAQKFVVVMLVSLS